MVEHCPKILASEEKTTATTRKILSQYVRILVTFPVSAAVRNSASLIAAFSVHSASGFFVVVFLFFFFFNLHLSSK